jgi:hypothetical protein
MELKTDPQTGFQGDLRGFANEKTGDMPFKNAPVAFKNAPRAPSGQGDPSDIPPSQIAKKRPSTRSAVIDAFVRQNSDAAKAVQAVVDNPSEGAFAQLMSNLPALLPTDPALASVIADEMAKVYGEEFHHTEAQRRGELANEECRAENPATCRVHGTPTRKIRAVKSSPAADSQAQVCGYANVKDMMAKAETVASDRVAAIQDGYSGKCKAHEAVAVITENRPFNDAEGNTVDFGGDIIEHYVEGRRRRDNMPKITNLEDLPFAIKAVKTDTYGVTRLKYPHGTTPDPQNPPRGTQREYHLPTDHGEMKVFVYIQGGHINGWHVAK